MQQNWAQSDDEKMDLQDYARMCINGNEVYSDWLSWHESWVHEAKNNPNAFVYFYEDICENPERVIKSLAKFLEIEISNENMKKVLESIDYKKSVDRRGTDSKQGKPSFKKIGGSREALGEELWARFKIIAAKIDPIFKPRFD